MNIYILDAVNLITLKQYSYIIVAKNVKEALTKFNGHDGADIASQKLFLYSTVPTASQISYSTRGNLLASVDGMLSDNNAVTLYPTTYS